MRKSGRENEKSHLGPANIFCTHKARIWWTQVDRIKNDVNYLLILIWGVESIDRLYKELEISIWRDSFHFKTRP